MERHQIAIVIPALNEESTIAKIVLKASAYGVPIVVNDGSNDRTSELAAVAGARVINHSESQGYDAALNSGFLQADILECKYIITMDADGQHDPLALVSFIKALDNGADIAIGIRDRHQRIAEYIFSWFSFVTLGVSDPLCGLKAYRVELYKELGHFDSYSSIGTELTIYAANQCKNIIELPVRTIDRKDESRFGSVISSNVKILRSLILSIWKKISLY